MLSVYHDVARSFEATAGAFGADPWIFTVIFALSIPVFWHFFFQAFKRWQQSHESLAPTLTALTSAAAPYLYLVVWGVHVPSWAYDMTMAGVIAGSLALHQVTRRYQPRWIPDLGLYVLALEVAPTVIERRRR